MTEFQFMADSLINLRKHYLNDLDKCDTVEEVNTKFYLKSLKCLIK